jgi:hypothetical protein
MAVPLIGVARIEVGGERDVGGDHGAERREHRLTGAAQALGRGGSRRGSQLKGRG